MDEQTLKIYQSLTAENQDKVDSLILLLAAEPQENESNHQQSYGYHR